MLYTQITVSQVKNLETQIASAKCPVQVEYIILRPTVGQEAGRLPAQECREVSIRDVLVISVEFAYSFYNG